MLNGLGKAAGADKKLKKIINSKYQPDSASSHPGPLSPPSFSPPHFFSFSPSKSTLSPLQDPILSPFGPMSQSTSRKTFYYLIATLNVAFPDYDFSQITPNHFQRIPSLLLAINAINTTLINLGKSDLVQRLGIWDRINQFMELDECEIYSFIPDDDSNPYSGAIWAYNFFFFNKKQGEKKRERVLFFSLYSMRYVSFLLFHDHLASLNSTIIRPNTGDLNLDDDFRIQEDDEELYASILNIVLTVIC